jgi:hypothetical protein
MYIRLVMIADGRRLDAQRNEDHVVFLELIQGPKDGGQFDPTSHKQLCA